VIPRARIPRQLRGGHPPLDIVVGRGGLARRLVTVAISCNKKMSRGFDHWVDSPLLGPKIVTILVVPDG
jgi:hypothetical protein